VIVVIIVDASLLFSSAFFPRNFYPQLAMFAHERATSHDNDILLCSPRLAILPAECQSRPHHPLVRRATRERERERERLTKMSHLQVSQVPAAIPTSFRIFLARYVSRLEFIFKRSRTAPVMRLAREKTTEENARSHSRVPDGATGGTH